MNDGPLQKKQDGTIFVPNVLTRIPGDGSQMVMVRVDAWAKKVRNGWLQRYHTAQDQ